MNVPSRTRDETGWRAVLAEMLAGTLDATLRFPVTVVFILLMALNASLLIEDSDFFGGGGTDFVLPFFAGALASMAASLFAEARGLDLWARHCGSVIAALIGFGLIWLDLTAQTLEWILLPGLGGLMLVAPYLGRGTPGAFWLFDARVAFAIVLAILALLLFAGGISAILASLTYLFGVPVPDRLYAHVWAISGLFGAPLFGLGQIPKAFDVEPNAMAAGFMERGMRALGDFVAAPLLIIYAAILHLYAVKIVVTGAVPQGQIGWLVLAFGFCVFGALVLINPFFDAARAPTRLVLRFWPVALPVPLVLLGYALLLRCESYGITPERYLLGLFGLTAALLVVLQIPRYLRGDIRFMAALPALALVLGSFGPQGAVATSIRSQADRFLGIIEKPPVEGRRHDEALASLRFLSAEQGLQRVAPEGFANWGAETSRYRAIARAYDLDPDRPRSFGSRFFNLNYAQPGAFDSGGFDTGVANLALYGSRQRNERVTLPSGRNLALALERDAISVTLGDETARFVIENALLRDLVRSGGGDAPRLELSSGQRQIAFIPTYLHGTLEPEARVDNITGTLLLRSQDW